MKSSKKEQKKPYTKFSAWIMYGVIFLVFCLASPLYMLIQYIWSVSTAFTFINALRVVLVSCGISIFITWLIYMLDRDLYDTLRE